MPKCGKYTMSLTVLKSRFKSHLFDHAHSVSHSLPTRYRGDLNSKPQLLICHVTDADVTVVPSPLKLKPHDTKEMSILSLLRCKVL